MVRISLVLLVFLLLLNGCSCGCPDGAMRITGYGIGRYKSDATISAWNNANRKLEDSGLEGHALVEDNTTFGRKWQEKVAVLTATIRFCVVPVQPASTNESVEPSR